MRDQVEHIRSRLEAISEELADLALDELREAVRSEGDDPGRRPSEKERRLSRARRAVEKAVAVLGEQ